ncbi:hypothetical protein NUH87_30850 [Pseudomonas batumici]|uniref:hypothetical protein n=1 Tax=Pseudomonas batumici TaxID=226910 RepID=UPI0030CD5CD5
MTLIAAVNLFHNASSHVNDVNQSSGVGRTIIGNAIVGSSNATMPQIHFPSRDVSTGNFRDAIKNVDSPKINRRARTRAHKKKGSSRKRLSDNSGAKNSQKPITHAPAPGHFHPPATPGVKDLSQSVTPDRKDVSGNKSDRGRMHKDGELSNSFSMSGRNKPKDESTRVKKKNDLRNAVKAGVEHYYARVKRAELEVVKSIPGDFIYNPLDTSTPPCNSSKLSTEFGVGATVPDINLNSLTEWPTLGNKTSETFITDDTGSRFSHQRRLATLVEDGLMRVKPTIDRAAATFSLNKLENQLSSLLEKEGTDQTSFFAAIDSEDRRLLGLVLAVDRFLDAHPSSSDSEVLVHALAVYQQEVPAPIHLVDAYLYKLKGSLRDWVDWPQAQRELQHPSNALNRVSQHYDLSVSAEFYRSLNPNDLPKRSDIDGQAALNQDALLISAALIHNQVHHGDMLHAAMDQGKVSLEALKGNFIKALGTELAVKKIAENLFASECYQNKTDKPVIFDGFTLRNAAGMTVEQLLKLSQFSQVPGFTLLDEEHRRQALQLAISQLRENSDYPIGSPEHSMVVTLNQFTGTSLPADDSHRAQLIADFQALLKSQPESGLWFALHLVRSDSAEIVAGPRADWIMRRVSDELSQLAKADKQAHGRMNLWLELNKIEVSEGGEKTASDLEKAARAWLNGRDQEDALTSFIRRLVDQYFDRKILGGQDAQETAAALLDYANERLGTVLVDTGETLLAASAEELESAIKSYIKPRTEEDRDDLLVAVRPLGATLDNVLQPRVAPDAAWIKTDSNVPPKFKILTLMSRAGYEVKCQGSTQEYDVMLLGNEGGRAVAVVKDGDYYFVADWETGAALPGTAPLIYDGKKLYSEWGPGINPEGVVVMGQNLTERVTVKDTLLRMLVEPDLSASWKFSDNLAVENEELSRLNIPSFVMSIYKQNLWFRSLINDEGSFIGRFGHKQKWKIKLSCETRGSLISRVRRSPYPQTACLRQLPIQLRRELQILRPKKSSCTSCFTPAQAQMTPIKSQDTTLEQWFFPVGGYWICWESQGRQDLHTATLLLVKRRK